MVGTNHWLDDWVAHVWACKHQGMDNKSIAASLTARFPSGKGGKDFNAGGVKYVLGNKADPSIPRDQVLSGGINKTKKPAKSKSSARAQHALSKVGIGSPAASVASSFDPTPQTGDRRQIDGAGSNSASFDSNPRPVKVPSSASRSTPQLAHPKQRRDETDGMGTPYGQAGSYAHPGLRPPLDPYANPYAPVPTAGGSSRNPVTIDDDGHDAARQRMQRPATLKSQEQQAMVDRFGMRGNAPNQYRSQDGYVQQLQPQHGQNHSASDNPLARFVNQQTQQVHAGVGGAAQVGLGLAGDSALQNFYPPAYVQNSSQGPAQANHTLHGLPMANNPSVPRNTGSNTTATNNMTPTTPVVSHGLPIDPELFVTGNPYAQNGRSISSQRMSGPQDTGAMMGNANGMASGGRQSTPGGSTLTTPKKSVGGQNMRPTSASKTRRPRDAFDPSDEGGCSENLALLDVMGNPRGISVPAPQLVPSSRNAPPQVVPPSQNAPKRKRQEEPAGVQMSAVGVGGRNNGAGEMNPQKRRKQDDTNATMMGRSQQIASTPALQSPPPAIQNGAAAAGNVQLPKVFNVGTVEQGYNPDLLQRLRVTTDGQTQTLLDKHKQFVNHMMGIQGGLNPTQKKIAHTYHQQLLEGRGLQATGAMLQIPNVANSETSNQHTRSDGNAAGSHHSGMPQTTMSLPEQQEQFRLMQQKVLIGNNGTAGAPMAEQTGTSQNPSRQQTSRQTNGNHNMNTQALGHPTPSVANGAAIPPLRQGSYLNTSDASHTPRAAAHKFDGSPISQPTPNMNRPTTPATQQPRGPGNGVATIPSQNFPSNSNRSMSAPQQAQLAGNGAGAMQATGGYISNSSNGIPSTAPNVGSSHSPVNPAGGNAFPRSHPQPGSIPMQKSSSLPAQSKVSTNQGGGGVPQYSPPKPASVTMQKSTSMPAPTTRPSVDPRTSGMQPPQHQQRQVQGMNRGAQVFNGQRAPRAAIPSGANSPHQNPYQSNADIGSRVTTNQTQVHDQPLRQAVNNAVSGGSSTRLQSSVAKTPSPSSNSGTGSDQSSPPSKASPQTGSQGAVSDFRLVHGVWMDVANVNMLELSYPVFHQHFTFPAERDGLAVVIDHINDVHKVVHGQNIVILTGAQFTGGVSWPAGQAPHHPLDAAPTPPAQTRQAHSYSQNTAPPPAQQNSPPKPRRKPAPKKAPSPPTSAPNATMAGPVVQSGPSRTSPAVVPQPPNSPVRPAEYTLVPAPPHPPLRLSESVRPHINSNNTPNPPRPDLHLNLKNVSPKTSMRKAGLVEKQVEAGFPALFVEGSNSCPQSASANSGEQTSPVEDDDDGLEADIRAAFEELDAPAENETSPVEDDEDRSGLMEELFGKDDDENITDPSASAHSGDPASSPPHDDTAPSTDFSTSPPAVASPPPPTILPTASLPLAAGDAQQGNQTFVDKAQPVPREGLAPKSILSNSQSTQQPGHTNQHSSEPSSRQAHIETTPRPVEKHILAEVSAVEWLARQHIPQVRACSSPLPPEEPFPDFLLDGTSINDPIDPAMKETIAIRQQEKWLQDIFPDYPLLTRVDVTCLNKPEWKYVVDVSEPDSFFSGSQYPCSTDPRWRVGKVDYCNHGIPEVDAALDMLLYVRRWGELCTHFDKDGKPIMAARPNPARKAFNEKMKEELRGNGPMGKKAAWEKWFFKEWDEKYEVWKVEEAKKKAEEDAKKGGDVEEGAEVRVEDEAVEAA